MYSYYFVLLVLVPGGGYVKRFNYICMLKLQLTQAAPVAPSQLHPVGTLKTPKTLGSPNPTPQAPCSTTQTFCCLKRF